VKESAVAAVCDRRLLFISTAWSALIERRYNSFTPSGGEGGIVTKLIAFVFGGALEEGTDGCKVPGATG